LKTRWKKLNKTIRGIWRSISGAPPAAPPGILQEHLRGTSRSTYGHVQEHIRGSSSRTCGARPGAPTASRCTSGDPPGARAGHVQEQLWGTVPPGAPPGHFKAPPGAPPRAPLGDLK